MINIYIRDTITVESAGERILKIDHYFAKLTARTECPSFDSRDS